MARKPRSSRAGVHVVTRLGEDDWRVWREVRLAALADASSAETPGARSAR